MNGSILIRNLDSQPVIVVCNPQNCYNQVIQAICLNDQGTYAAMHDIIIIQLNGIRVANNAEFIRQYLPDKLNDIQWFTRQRGGIFKELISFFMGLLKLVLYIPKTLIWIVALILWLIKALFFLIVYAGKYITNDGITGLVRFLILDLFMAPFSIIFGLIKKGVNWLGRNTVQAIWGADNVPEPGEDIDSDSIAGADNCAPGSKCYKTEAGTVPFSVIITTVLCPPVGVFMEYGISGWIKIILCSLLTLVFYFPGLIYAMILIYC
jgi:uncharacterized membrane protein YqaE (UPF0057 family)